MAEESLDWPANYFNYFTEIEERFREARGTGLFLLSPLDWALIESWKDSGVPLEAVVRGIDDAFTKWRSRKRKTQAVNSLAYCAQAVLKSAEELARGGGDRSTKTMEPPFPLEALREHLEASARHLSGLAQPAYQEIAIALKDLADRAEDHFLDLEPLEQRLTALEEKMLAIARSGRTTDDLFNARRELDDYLRPYRSRMTAEQLATIERQFLDRRLLDDSGLRRLSLFYLGG